MIQEQASLAAPSPQEGGVSEKDKDFLYSNVRIVSGS